MNRTEKIASLKSRIAGIDEDRASLASELHGLVDQRDKDDRFSDVEVTWGNLKFKGMPAEHFFVDSPGVIPFLDEDGTRLGKAFCSDGGYIKVVVDDAETTRRIMDPTNNGAISVGYSVSDEGDAHLASAQLIGLGGSRTAFDAGVESARSSGVDVQSSIMPTWEMVTKYSAIGRNQDGEIAASWMLESSGPGSELKLTYRGRLHADGIRPAGMERDPWWGFSASVKQLSDPDMTVLGSALVVQGDKLINIPLRLWIHPPGPQFVGEVDAVSPIGADMCLVRGPVTGRSLAIGIISIPCPADGDNKLLLERLVAAAIHPPQLSPVAKTELEAIHTVSKIAGILGMPVEELAASCRGMGITIAGSIDAELSGYDVNKIWGSLTRRQNVGGRAAIFVREVIRADAHGNKHWDRDPIGNVSIEPDSTLTVSGIVADFAIGKIGRHAAESALRSACGLTQDQVDRVFMASDAVALEAERSRLMSETKEWLITELKGISDDLASGRISVATCMTAIDLLRESEELDDIRDASKRLERIFEKMRHHPGDDERRDKAWAKMNHLKHDDPTDTKSSEIIHIGDTTVIVDGVRSLKVTSLKIVRVTGSRDSVDITFDFPAGDLDLFKAIAEDQLPVTLSTDSLAFTHMAMTSLSGHSVVFSQHHVEKP